MIFLQNCKILRNRSKLFHLSWRSRIANDFIVRDKKYFGSKLESMCVRVDTQHTRTSDLSYYLATKSEHLNIGTVK